MILTFFFACSLLFLWLSHVFVQLKLPLQAEQIFKKDIGGTKNEMCG